MIKEILNKIFHQNSPIYKDSPTYKMMQDIIKDYGVGGKTYNENGFLEHEFFIKGNPYKIISTLRDNSHINLKVENTTNKETVFKVEMRYGISHDKEVQHIIYIDKFYRMTEYSEGVGSKVAYFIKSLAERERFDEIWLNAVSDNQENHLNQEDLFNFYTNKLSVNGRAPKLNKDSTSISELSWITKK